MEVSIDRGRKMNNADKETIEVYWAQLKQSTDEESYKRECPFCENGLFLVGRARDTGVLEALDRCISCAQMIRYLDIEQMRERERPSYLAIL